MQLQANPDISYREVILLNEPKNNKPFISYFPSQDLVQLKGNCEGVPSFTPLMSYVKTHLDTARPLKLEINLRKINASGVKGLIDVLYVLNKAHKNGHRVEVVWTFETNDSYMWLIGMDIKKLYSFDFTFTPLIEDSSVNRTWIEN